MDKHYFDRPTQVVFGDPDNPGHWCAGIAYKDEIICACCGGIFNIDELYELLEGYIDHPIYEYKEWINLTEEILGGELPEGLARRENYEDYLDLVEVPTEEDHVQMEIADVEEIEAVFANTWVDGVAMPSIN